MYHAYAGDASHKIQTIIIQLPKEREEDTLRKKKKNRPFILSLLKLMTFMRFMIFKTEASVKIGPSFGNSTGQDALISIIFLHHLAVYQVS